MGSNPVGWTAPGDLPPQGDEKVGGYATSETDRQDIELPPTRKLPAEGGIGYDGDLHIHTPE